MREVEIIPYGRDAKVITYSKMFGEVSRLIISPDMVRYGQGHRQR